MLWGGAAAGERAARLLDAYSHWFARLLVAYSHWLHLFDFSPMCVFKRGGAAAEERAGDKLLSDKEAAMCVGGLYTWVGYKEQLATERLTFSYSNE